MAKRTAPLLYIYRNISIHPSRVRASKPKVKTYFGGLMKVESNKVIKV